MAWQLIYTSAPRSLEAGRSGFGTVARHRAISPLLVSAIERASQFSRLPGTDAGRVIFSHRIVAIAGGRFHVLSAIRDAGADYTGRTNHIAHHLIVDPREVAQLGHEGPSPADVLLAMHWVASWNEQPRYFESTEEVALSAMRPQTNGSAWQKITGDANQARLLATGDASRGAYIIQPGDANLRAVFAESLRLIPERLWEISFTTSLQPSDEPADFRWIGIEERSPLRAQIESSGRPVLNLAAPDTLPPVEKIEPAAMNQRRDFSAPVSTPVWPETWEASLGIPVATPEPNSFHTHERSAEAQSAAAARSSRIHSKWWMPAGAIAAVFLIGALVFSNFVKPYLERQKARDAMAQRFDALNYFVNGVGRKLADSLITSPDATRCKQLASASETLIQTLRDGKLEQLNSKTTSEHLEVLANRDGLQLPQELGNLREVVTVAKSFSVEPSYFKNPAVANELHANMEKRLLEISDWGAGKQLPSLLTSLKLNTERQAASRLLLMLSQHMTPPEGTESFEKAVEDFSKIPDTEVKDKIAEIKTRMKERKVNQPPSKSESKPVKPAPSPQERFPLLATKTTAAPPVLHFIAENKGVSIDLPPTGSLKFFLRQRGKNEEELRPFGGDIKSGLGDYGATFKVPNGKLEPGSKPPEPPYELSIRNQESSEVLHIYVGPPDNSQQLIADKSLELKRDDHMIRITGAFPRIAESAKPNFMLVTDAGFDGSKQVKTFAVTADHDCELKDVLSNLQARIAERRNEANRLSQQAAKESADAQSVDGIRKRAKEYVATLKTEDAKAFNLESKTGAELVGDFAKALADEWNEKKNKSKFEGLREAGRALGNAFGKPEEAKIKNKELQSEARKLQNTVSGEEKIKGLAVLNDLCDKLAALFGDAAAIETKISKLRAGAENAEHEAKQIESQPLLNGKLPPGKYTLTVQFKDMNLNLYTFTVN